MGAGAGIELGIEVGAPIIPGGGVGGGGGGGNGSGNLGASGAAAPFTLVPGASSFVGVTSSLSFFLQPTPMEPTRVRAARRNIIFLTIILSLFLFRN